MLSRFSLSNPARAGEIGKSEFDCRAIRILRARRILANIDWLAAACVQSRLWRDAFAQMGVNALCASFLKFRRSISRWRVGLTCHASALKPAIAKGG